MIGRALRRLRALDDGAVGAWRTLRGGATIWHGLADLVTARPVVTLLASLALLTPPLLALPTLDLSHDELSELPDAAEAVQGVQAISRHVAPGELSPLILVIEDDSAVWDPEAFHALGLLSENLKQLPGVATVRSAAMPTDGAPPQQSVGGELGQLSGGVQESADGAARLADGVRQVEDGLAQVDQRLPELVTGLERAVDGAAQLHEGAEQADDGTSRLRDGVRQLRDGVTELRAGVSRARDGVSQLRDGLGELRAGLVEARDGAARLRDDVAAPTEDALIAAERALRNFTVGQTDPLYPEARRQVGEAYARVTGEYPPEHPQEGQPVQEGYEGLPEALGALADGLGEAVTGVDRLDGGLAELDAGLGSLGDGLGRVEDGLRQVAEGLVQLDQGFTRLADGLGELEDGLQRAVDGVHRLQDGIGQLLAGVSDQLRPGAEQLAEGLAQGAQRFERENLDQLLPTGEGPGPFLVTAGMLEVVPDLRQRLDFFVTDDATRTRVFVGTRAAPYDETAIAAVDDIERVAELSLNGSPLEDARVLATGTTAFFEDVDEVASRDFRLIMLAVVVGVLLVLALLLRSLVAPLYMVATVLLSFGVALGITTFVFQVLLGQAGIAWFVPSMLFVLLVALGVDYNIFLMSRVREEARTRPTRTAVALGLTTTGHVITSAGLILAGTFAALMAAPLRSLNHIGFAVAVGVLLDTFIVRSLLVPSIAVLLGRWNWWPSARSREEPAPV